MMVDVREEQQRTDTTPERDAVEQTDTDETARPSLSERIRAAFAAIEWRQTLGLAVVMAIGWCALFLSQNILQALAGIVPVLAGLYLGRRVKSQLLLHGLVLSVTGFLIGMVIVSIYALLVDSGLAPPYLAPVAPGADPMPITSGELILLYLSFSAFALLPFPTFATVMSGHSERRNRETRRQIEERGGRLERPGAVRTLEDLRGLSLPQLGTYVSNLFKKNGFTFRDWRFLDKDKHLDIELEYQGEIYLLRLSVADKVRPGTVQSLVQDMRRREIKKGLVITSTEFMPDALKSARGYRHIVAIDGQTLFEMAES